MNAPAPDTARRTSPATTDEWTRIGTVVGNTSTGGYTFILRSFQAKLGDIVATRTEVPVAAEGARNTATVWGRIVAIEQVEPVLPGRLPRSSPTRTSGSSTPCSPAAATTSRQRC